MNINDLVTIINSKYFSPEEKLWAKAEFQRRKDAASVVPKFMKPTACTYKKDVPECETINCNDCPHAMKTTDEAKEKSE